MVDVHLDRHLQRKQAELERWLADNAADVERQQRHLVEGTAERAYWHYGYWVALRDIRTLLGPGRAG